MQAEKQVIWEILYRLRGGQIQEYSYGTGILRLVLFTPVAQKLKPPADFLNLVLEGCHTLYYLSYIQTLETRTEQHNPEQIFAKGLMLQGVERQPENQFVLYCNSYLNTVEAGELHLQASGYQLYNSEFDRISLLDFRQAADKSGNLF